MFRLFIYLGKCHFGLQLFNCHHYMQPATHSSFCPQICSVKKLSFLIADSSNLFIFYVTSALAHLRHSHHNRRTVPLNHFYMILLYIPFLSSLQRLLSGHLTTRTFHHKIPSFRLLQQEYSLC